MLKLFIKTLVQPFYAQHAGFLLFVFYLLFGAVEPGQLVTYQLALLSTIASSTTGTLVFCAILTLYLLKGLLFLFNKLKLPSYKFMPASGSVSRRTQYRNWAVVYLLISIPVASYLIAFIITAFYQGHYLNAGILLIYTLFLYGTATTLSFRRVNHQFKPDTIHLKIAPQFSKPFFTWRFMHLLTQQPILFIGAKVLSLFLLRGMIWVFGPTDNPLLVGLIALLAALLTHSMLIGEILKFDRTNLEFRQGLPVGPWKRLTGIAGFLTMLFIPELLLYMQTQNWLVSAFPVGLAFSIGGLLTLYYSGYSFDGQADPYIRFIFGFFVACFLAILYKQVLIFSLLLLCFITCYNWYLYKQNRLST